MNIRFNPNQKERYLQIIDRGMRSRYGDFESMFPDLTFEQFKVTCPPHFLAGIEICLENAGEDGTIDVEKARVVFEQRFGQQLFPDVLDKIWGNTTDFLREGNEAWDTLGREIQVGDDI